MSYLSAPVRYQWGPVTWTSDVTHYIVGPTGKKGQLWDYGVMGVTTTFAGGTTTPSMKVGITGTLAKYGVLYDFGLLATTVGMKSIRSTYAISASGYSTYILQTLDIIATSTSPVVVTCVAATGGGAAGVAIPFVDIKWED